jgi:two-component system, NarL family, invasion response regulator UvrY
VIRVLLADDHAVVRRGLHQILSETDDIQVEGEASSSDELRTLARDRRWDVVILDIHMPGGNGMELLRELRRDYPGACVLVLTAYQEAEYGVRAVRAGAAGFLTKESAAEQLIEAVRKIAAGGKYVSPELAETLASVVAGEIGGALHERLSDREFEILKALALGRTVSQIGQDLQLSVKTVSTHRTRILKKMNMSSNAELMRYAMTHRLV